MSIRTDPVTGRVSCVLYMIVQRQFQVEEFLTQIFL